MKLIASAVLFASLLSGCAMVSHSPRNGFAYIRIGSSKIGAVKGTLPDGTKFTLQGFESDGSAEAVTSLSQALIDATVKP